jgi:hypothetical protein
LALSPEWKEQIQALSYSELKAEIGREETELGELYQSLYDADERLGEVEEQVRAESQRDEAQRWLGRQRNIQRLRTRIAERQRQIDDLTQKALGFERMPSLISIVQRYIRLEVAASLWRTVNALQGWQTREQRSLASYQGWQTREAPLTERLRQLLGERAKWKREADTLATRIKVTEAQIAYKKEILPKVKLSRVSIALYLIIESGEHTYPRDGGHYTLHRPHFRRVRHNVKYPKGKFQSILQCDSFIDPGTGELRTDIDPFRTLEGVMRAEVADEFIEEFSLKEMNPDDLTLGVVNIVAGEEEIGKPPFKLYISRTDEETGRDWRTTINKYLMLQAEYRSLIKDMKEYIEALEAMG